MKAKWIKKSLCLLLCLSMAGIAVAQSNTPSILERVQKVDDPELAELIRLAKERWDGRKTDSEITRKVTLSYVQIKLLDQQIAEVSRKIKAETSPAGMRYELMLAKTELEAKLMTELVNLREIMGIIPKRAFEEQPIGILNSWVHLHVLDQGVHVLDSLKPFEEYWGRWRLKSSGLLSKEETLDYVRERLRNKTKLPIRIDLHHTAAMRSSAEDLRRKIVSLATETNSQMEAEINLKLLHWIGSGESTFFIREGTISTLHASSAQIVRPDGDSKSKPIVTGVVEPSDLEQHILWRLMHPGLIPLKYRIEHDETSAKLARQTADRIRAVAKDLSIGELVDIERILVEPLPESAFLGQWQAITRGDIQTINVQPIGVCVFEMSDRFTLRNTTEAIKPGESVPGRWFLTPKEIFMDIKDYHQPKGYYVYRGHLDKQGNLVVAAGIIYPQGSFHHGAKRIVVFKKVE